MIKCAANVNTGVGTSWNKFPIHRMGTFKLDVVQPAFPLPTTASPTLQGVLKDGLGEAVVACDMPKPCEFPSLDSCQKRFLWTHKEFYLAPHPVVVLCSKQKMRPEE